MQILLPAGLGSDLSLFVCFSFEQDPRDGNADGPWTTL